MKGDKSVTTVGKVKTLFSVPLFTGSGSALFSEKVWTGGSTTHPPRTTKSSLVFEWLSIVVHLSPEIFSLNNYIKTTDNESNPLPSTST